MVSRRRSGRWRVLTCFLALAGVAGVVTWYWIRRDHPPVQALLEAQMYLNLARECAPEDAARPILESAEQNLDDAERSLRAEYRRLILLRNYDLSRYHIDRARVLCGDAISTAREARQEAGAQCLARLAGLRRSLQTTRGLIYKLTIRGDAITRLTSTEVLLNAADARLTEHETREAEELPDRAEQQLSEASINLQARLTRFLERRQEWNRWIRDALAESSGKSDPLLLVDKLNHELYVLRRGRVVESFAVEFGNSWMDRKLQEGDRATPEGHYRISQLKSNGNSRYYKAALLDYPNAADRTRFVAAKRAGSIPRSARIGGLIEIHGEGGRGSNWTSGCISLSNRDMDRLMSFLRVGTQVTIVGVWQEPAWLSSNGHASGASASKRVD